jgi:hypothetical protein
MHQKYLGELFAEKNNQDTVYKCDKEGLRDPDQGLIARLDLNPE